MDIGKELRIIQVETDPAEETKPIDRPIPWPPDRAPVASPEQMSDDPGDVAT